MCAVWTSLCVSKFEIGFLAIEEDAWHSDRRLHVISQISLWRWIGKAPLGHDKTCSTVNGSLQAHLVGIRTGNQLYQIANASRNALLYRANPWSSRGGAISHEEAPLSLARSTDLFCGGFSFDWVLVASSSSWSLRFFFTSSFALVISSNVSWENHCHYWSISQVGLWSIRNIHIGALMTSPGLLFPVLQGGKVVLRHPVLCLTLCFGQWLQGSTGVGWLLPRESGVRWCLVSSLGHNSSDGLLHVWRQSMQLVVPFLQW